MSSSVRLIGIGQRDEWEAALVGLPHLFTHTYDYCSAIGGRTQGETFLLEITSAKGRAVCTLFERGGQGAMELVSPYGVAGFAGTTPSKEALEIFGDFARRRGYVCAYVGQHPLCAMDGFAEGEDVYEEKPLYVLDLSLSPDALLERMSSNRRRQIRATDSCCVTEGGVAARFLVAQYSPFMDARQASPVYAFGLTAIEQLCRAASTIVVGARSADGPVVSASLFGYAGPYAEFLFNAATEEGRRQSTAIIWHAALRLRSLGVVWLNLGGGVQESDRLSEYKRRFGAVGMPLRSLRQVYDRPRYEELCRQAGVDTSEAARWFPPYRSLR